jgi:integrase
VPILVLTDLAVKALRPGVYFDTKTPSFGIRVGKNRRTWIVLKGENRTKVRLGHYPAMSLQDARKKAFTTLGSPLEPPPAPPFVEARDQFLETHGATLRLKSRYQLTRTLRRHFHWKKAVDKITHADVADVIDRIKAKSEAAHALKDIRTFFNWCVPRFIPHSPCEGIRMPPQKSRDRVLADEEIMSVWHRADELGYPYGTIVKLLILTGLRTGEVAALGWNWIDGATLTIPATIAKNGRSSTVPIGPMTKSVVESVHKRGALLFPARGYDDKPFQGFGVSKIELDTCGVRNFTHHDLRRTFATNLAALGTPIHVTEKLLNHVSGTTGGIVAIYQRHSYMDEMRVAILAWENKLASLTKQC